MADISTSRYAGTTGVPSAPSSSTTTSAPSSSSTSQSSSGATASNSNTKGTQNTTTTQNTTNMDPQSLAVLQLLIQQLMGGGTQTMAQQQAQRQQEIQYDQNARAGYSKASAFADAQGAMALQLRKAMESGLPSITRASEGAGTSQNSLRALLVQKQAQEASEQASSLGLKAAVDYGNIGATLSSVLERLTAGADPVSSALLQALGIAKGAISNTKGTSKTVTDQTTNQAGSSVNNSTSTTQNSGQSQTTTVGPAGSMGSSGGSSGGLSLMGSPQTEMSANAQNYNSTASLLQMLDAAGAYGDKYTF